MLGSRFLVITAVKLSRRTTDYGTDFPKALNWRVLASSIFVAEGWSSSGFKRYRSSDLWTFFYLSLSKCQLPPVPAERSDAQGGSGA